MLTSSPALQASLLAIAKALLENRCTILLGSGISTEAGVPSALALSQRLQQEIPDYPGPQDLPTVAQAYESIYSLPVLKRTIRTHLLPTLSASFLDLQTHNLIARLPNADFITTNWDKLLESALPPTTNTVFLESDLPYWDSARPNILKMHGCISSPSSLVVTRREYETYQSDFPSFASKVREMMTGSTLVICGYSMEDLTFRLLFKDARGREVRRFPNAFWIEPNAQPHNSQDWANHGIRFLPTDARTFFSSLVDTLSLPPEPPEHSPYERLLKIVQDCRALADILTVTDHVAEFGASSSLDRLKEIAFAITRYTREALRYLETFATPQLEKLLVVTAEIADIPLSVERALQSRSFEKNLRESLTVLLREVISRSIEPLFQLRIRLEQRINLLEGQPFASVSSAATDAEARELAKLFVESTGLLRFSKLLELLRTRRAELQAILVSPTEDATLKSELLFALWRSFDVVLLEEYYGRSEDRSQLLRAILSNSENQSVRRMLKVMQFFSCDRANDTTGERVEALISLWEFEARDAQVVYRCLTYHPYSASARTHGIQALELSALWTLLAIPSYPIGAVAEAASRIFSKESLELQKVFLDLKWEDLTALLAAPLAEPQVLDVERTLFAFSESAMLLEDKYHERFVNLVQRFLAVGAATVSTGFRAFFEAILLLRQELTTATPPPIELIKALPDEVRARLEKNLFYLYYYSTHPVDSVAVTALDLITSEHTWQLLLRNRSLNPALLRRIAGRRSLLTKHQTRRLVAFHPKAVPAFAGVFARDLSRGELRELLASHEANPAMRKLAEQLLGPSPEGSLQSPRSSSPNRK